MIDIDIISKVVSKGKESAMGSSSQNIDLSSYATLAALSNYIPISGYTDVLGEKNFTGGLKVNGSPIVYDATNKYWKLEGDLIVTGGVTMYANEGTYTPSTIMDAIVVDGVTISKDGGVLKVIGGTSSGGTITSITSQMITDALGYTPVSPSVLSGYLPLSGGVIKSNDVGLTIIRTNIYPIISYVGGDTSSQTFYGAIGFGGVNKPIYVDKTGNNIYTLWHEGNFNPSNYLPLTGGTLSNTLTISNSSVGLILYRSGDATPYIRFAKDADNSFGELGVNYSGNLVYWPTISSVGGYNKWNKVWHEGNDGSGSGLDADLLDGKHYTDIINGNVATSTRINAYQHNSGEKVLISGTRTDGTFPRKIFDDGWGLALYRQTPTGTIYQNYIATISDNVASATKLQTARTIWGQSFDGTANVSGSIYLGNNANILWKNAGGTTDLANIYTNSSNDFILGKGSTTIGAATYLEGNTIYLRTSSSRTAAVYIDATQKVGLGTGSPAYRLDIVGDSRSKYMYFFNKDWNGNAGYVGRASNANNKIVLYAGSDTVDIYSKGTLSATFDGTNLLVQGGITMYSAKKLKDIKDENGLSLEELSIIKPTRFTWKDGRDDKVHIGGIADDVQKVLPEVIYKSEDTLTMDYGNAAFAIAASLIKPVISHEERIKALEEENKKLKEEIELLKWNIA